MLSYSGSATISRYLEAFLVYPCLSSCYQECVIAVIGFWYSSQWHYSGDPVRDYSPAQGQAQQTEALSEEQVNQEGSPKSSFTPGKSLSQGPVSFPVAIAKWYLCKCPETAPAGAAPLYPAISHLTAEVCSSAVNLMVGFE